MVKKRNKGDNYYWCCEKRKSEGCKGHVTTILKNGLHLFKDFSNHNYSSQASSAIVAKDIAGIKSRACKTREKPIQIIQNSIVCIFEKICPYMLLHNALHRKITHVRKIKMPSEPQSIVEINILNSLYIILNRELFLVKDYVIEQNNINY